MTKPLTAKQRKKRKRIILRRRVLLLLFIVAVIISICLFTPFFNLKSVDVIGNQQIATEQILSAAAVPNDINLFKIRKKAIKKSVLQIPEIETIEIRRKLPDTLQIEVTETQPFMYFPYMTGYVITNEAGRIMSIVDNVEGQDLLFLTGLEIKNAEICKKISVQDTVTFDIIIETMQKLCDVGLQTEIQSAHFDNLSDVYFIFKDGTKIILGKTTDIDYKISVLSKILPKVDRTEGAYIDLTTPSHAIYGIADPTPAPSAESGPESAESSITDENAPADNKEPENDNR